MGIQSKRQDMFQTNRTETLWQFIKIILKCVLGKGFIEFEMVRKWLKIRLKNAVLKKWWKRTRFNYYKRFKF
jgi:hypothetical protein